MPVFPEDIFTEPTDVDPDTLANLGPLRRLAGSWEARKGVDVNPKAGGPERRVFIERIDLDPIDPQANGPQLFYGLRYHIHITTEEEDTTFHDQVGYWLWEPATGLVLQTLSIPRGQVAIASGQATADADRLVLSAERGQTEYGICSTAFLEYAFPHRQLSHRGRLQRRWLLELCDGHGVERPRKTRTVRPSRPEHAAENQRAATQSVVQDPCREARGSGGLTT